MVNTGQGSWAGLLPRNNNTVYMQGKMIFLNEIHLPQYWIFYAILGIIVRSKPYWVHYNMVYCKVRKKYLILFYKYFYHNIS